MPALSTVLLTPEVLVAAVLQGQPPVVIQIPTVVNVGAIVVFVLTALRLVVGLVQQRKNGGNGNGKDRAHAVASVKDRVDLAERAIQDNVNITRHALNENLNRVSGTLGTTMDEGFDRVVGKLEEIRDALRERGRP